MTPPRSQRQFDGEGGAFAFDAGGGDGAAHQLGELAADRQAQARAAEPAGRRGVGLGELVEEVGQLVRGDADAGVVHRQAQALRRGADADASTPPWLVNFMALEMRLASDLPQPVGSPRQLPSALGLDLHLVGEALLVAEWWKAAAAPSASPSRAKSRATELHAAGLDLRQVEDVVEDGQQQLAGLCG